jgi:hypothetical protein
VTNRAIGQAAPYATGAYFVLFLAAQASAEFIRPSDLVVPLLITCGVSAAAHLGAWLLTRAPDKAAFIATIVSVTFSTMGHVVNTLAEANALRMPGGMWTPITLMTIAAVASILAIARTSRSVAGVLPVITWAAGGLSLFNVFGGGRLIADSIRPGKLRPSEIAAPAWPTGVRPPDIYLIILDKYAGSDVLASQYQFDNTPFTDFLRRRGFTVPPFSRTNYVQTFLSLGSMLNVGYLDWLPDSLGTDNPRWVDAYHLVENNRVASFLRDRGYRFVFFPTALGVTRENRYADMQLPDPKDIRPEFVTAWLLTTAAPVFHYFACQLTACSPTGGPYIPETATLFDWKFEALAALPGGPQPLFVFAHLAVPHEPYIYAADCQHRRPYWPLHDFGDEAPKVREAYRDQIRCVNRKLTELITRLQERSAIEPVIMIQGDHGHGLLGRNLPGISEAAEWQIADRVSAFAAYMVPGMLPSTLPDSITPINAMRAMLRYTFGADLPPVEDATYWSSYDRPYRLRRVR